MAKQRYIYDSFWTDAYIETLNKEEKLFFLYLLTNPLCNIAGVYEITNSRISYETKLSINDIEKIKKKLIKDEKILVFKDWILISNFIKNQSLNENMKEGIRRIYQSLPDELKAWEGFQRLWKGRRYFTLLNLTIYSTSSKEEDATIKNNNKKTMKNSFKYNEKQHSDNFEDSIDIETGEPIKPKETKKQKAINYIKDYFSSKCEKEIKIKPVLTYKHNIIIANLFNKNKMKPSEITDVIDWWFETEQDKTKLIQISNCLSSWNINKFKVAKN